ncbi:MAG: hypothetical protein H8D45_27005 [Bacteroidetes bacterium]|nr:hypothetical protein [Bacteroidota bacterium]MBL7105298.1 hypothetical protein [Bacteroidales bacterium]
MKQFLIKYWFILLIIAGVVYSCKKMEEYPVIPAIEYEDFIKLYNPSQGIFDRGVFKISFTDGDGDIGLTQNDTLPPYEYNLFITYYEIQYGDTVEVVLTKYNHETGQYDTLTFNGRIPILTPQGSNKSIKGEIEDTLFIYNYSSDFDTIMYDAYIVDRALHKSNVVQTPLIIRK